MKTNLKWVLLLFVVYIFNPVIDIVILWGENLTRRVVGIQYF